MLELLADEPGLNVRVVAGDLVLGPVHRAPLVAPPVARYQAWGTPSYTVCCVSQA